MAINDIYVHFPVFRHGNELKKTQKWNILLGIIFQFFDVSAFTQIWKNRKFQYLPLTPLFFCVCLKMEKQQSCQFCCIFHTLVKLIFAEMSSILLKIVLIWNVHMNYLLKDLAFNGYSWASTMEALERGQFLEGPLKDHGDWESNDH